MEWTKVNEQSSVVVDYLEIPGFHALLLSLVLVLVSMLMVMLIASFSSCHVRHPIRNPIWMDLHTPTRSELLYLLR